MLDFHYYFDYLLCCYGLTLTDKDLCIVRFEKVLVGYHGIASFLNNYVSLYVKGKKNMELKVGE